MTTEQATVRGVPATLLASVPSWNAYPSAAFPYASARWRAPDGLVRTGHRVIGAITETIEAMRICREAGWASWSRTGPGERIHQVQPADRNRSRSSSALRDSRLNPEVHLARST
jgi:hypothetical protein